MYTCVSIFSWLKPKVSFLNHTISEIIDLVPMSKHLNPPFKTKFKSTHRILTKWKLKSNKVKKVSKAKQIVWWEMEFKEFESRFKSAKTRFKLSAGLNLETFDTVLSGTNHI